ncbi:MAG: HAD family phosphatase [Acidobacteria bacterium]|nr:HAD family phosphatase [Acidobacteriota bacterium]
MTSSSPAPALSTFRPRACVFDLDGTLVHNMPIHAEAFGVFAERHGLAPLTPADRRALDGKRNSEIFPVIFGRALTREEWMAYEEEKEGLYREISRGRLVAVPGLARLLASLDRHGIAVAIATSAPRANVEHSLHQLGIEALASRVVRGDEVPNGKPAPDVFVEAARRIGIAPDLCLAFEDAPVGLEAARAAGMRVVAMATTFPADELAQHATRPDAVVHSFDEWLDVHARWLEAVGPPA